MRGLFDWAKRSRITDFAQPRAHRGANGHERPPVARAAHSAASRYSILRAVPQIGDGNMIGAVRTTGQSGAFAECKPRLARMTKGPFAAITHYPHVRNMVWSLSGERAYRNRGCRPLSYVSKLRLWLEINVARIIISAASVGKKSVFHRSHSQPNNRL
jgi:hypothetical protein